MQWCIVVDMEAKDIIQRGDVFENDFRKVTVKRVRDDVVIVKNMAGMEERLSPREVVEITQK